MKVGFVGWRGMVGSVLMKRMEEESDFNYLPERHKPPHANEMALQRAAYA